MKFRLLQRYDETTEAYYFRLHKLRERTAISTKSEYHDLKDAVEKARAESEGARAALSAHVAMHGC